jgi:excisionase family DNA binding protein
MKSNQKLITQTEFAARLGVHRNTVRTWIDRGYLPKPAIPKPPRWTEEQIKNWNEKTLKL